VSLKRNSNDKYTGTELARSRGATGPDEKSAHEEIRRRAYEIYLERGGQSGGEIDDWLQAERELEGRSAVVRAGDLSTEHRVQVTEPPVA